MVENHYQATGCAGPGYKIYQYHGSGTSFVTEGLRDTGEKTAWGTVISKPWATREEAEAAAFRANAGDESGIVFGSYADD